MVYKDPTTGKIGVPPAVMLAPQLPPTMEYAVSRSSKGLMEVQDTGGGIMVDLQGRFRSFVTATKGANGKILISCSPSINPDRGQE